MGKGFSQAIPKITVGQAADVLFQTAHLAGKPVMLPMFPPGNDRGLKPGEMAPGLPEIPPSCDGIVCAIACSADDAQTLIDLITRWQRNRLKNNEAGGDRHA